MRYGESAWGNLAWRGLCAVVLGPFWLFMATPSAADAAPIRLESIVDVQRIGVDPAFPLDGDYLLTQDIDASGTVTWDGGAGFMPIGSNVLRFTGSFDGGGHAIVGLTINRPHESDTGLFGVTDRGSVVRNVRLYHATIHGGDRVGGLVGYSQGVFSNCHVTGTVSGDTFVGGLAGRVWGSHAEISGCWANVTVVGVADVGGLAGKMETHVRLEHSHAAGDVHGRQRVGGVVGSAKACQSLKSTSASGNVSGISEVGGLVGYWDYFYGWVAESYATGDVVGETHVGGLAGVLLWSGIRDSFAAGNVVGDEYVGGLLGARWFATLKGDGVTVRGAYATGSVAGRRQVGGLVGGGGCKILYSYATGDVAGIEYAGGLTGGYAIMTYTSYALGDVSGVSCVGGLTGYGTNNILYCYSAGRVIAEEGGGGLAGCSHYQFEAPTSFWDVERSGVVESGGGKGLPTEALVQEATFAAQNWDFTETWDIVEGVTYPFLRYPTQSPLPVAIGACGHSADRDVDCRLDLSEILRVIALFNAGGYHCAEAGEVSEDGYVPGIDLESQNCARHDSDFEAPEWRITILEVLRLVQFFNTGGYHDCSMLPRPGEDGFCPGRGLSGGAQRSMPAAP